MSSPTLTDQLPQSTLEYSTLPNEPGWKTPAARWLPWLAWIVPLVTYIGISIPIAVRNQYQMNPDGIIYWRKAQFLVAGHFLQSVSGYWSPGLTWCLAAILAVSPNSGALHVIHAVLTGWGFLWTASCCVFLYTIASQRPLARLIAGLALVTVGLRLAVVWMAPDLLLCTFLIAYLCCWNWPIKSPKRAKWAPLLGGMFAGLGYLCKSYALPFFVLHFPATLAYQHFIQKREVRWRRTLLLGFGGLAIFVVPWAGLLSAKYHQFTISMVYHHNHLNVAPASYLLKSSPDFCVVPEDPYLCVWEGLDPGPRKDWSPWSSYSLFRHQIAIAVDHVKLIVEEIYTFDWIALTLIAAVIALLPARWAAGRGSSSISAWLLMTAAIYCLGFLAVAFETRYIVPILLPMAIALCFAESERFRIGWGSVATASVYLIAGIIALWPYAWLNPPRPIFSRVAKEMQRHHLTQLFSSSNNNNGVNVSWYLNQKIVLLPFADDIHVIEQRLRAAGVVNLLVWTDSRTDRRDPFPRLLAARLHHTHHWKIVLRFKLDSARTIAIYQWIGP